MFLLVGSKSRILANGMASNLINSKRSLRQDDPLSPLFFILAADSFTRMLDLTVQNGALTGLGPNNFMGNLLSLQYTDDTLLFINIDEDSIRNLKLLLYGFKLASGLKINFHKSPVYQLDVIQSRHERWQVC